MGKGINKAMEAIAEAVFPSNIYCICCGALIDSSRPYSLCDKCVQEFHWITGKTCSRCGKALPDTYRGALCYDCMQHEHCFQKGYSCLTYGLHEREVLMDYKYNGKGYIGRKLGDILYDRISCENLQPDVIIPVPVSKERLRKRGYNQSAIMARQIARRMDISYNDRVLVRKKNTHMLRTMNPAERALAMADAFGIAAGGDKLKGKCVLLIDDIYTTGATADACSKVLLEAGADTVLFLSLASGGNRKPE
ncbi:MAG: ComF family protein [Bacillota bacterium]|nr:ComF family protein [Bacillota bacterium]